MKRNKKGGIKLDQGFTMIELIIVIAIMGILSAILVPSFTNITRKTRLKADVSTIQQIQTLIEVYMAENNGDYPHTSEDGGKEFKEGQLPPDAVKALVAGGYIKKSDTEKNVEEIIKLQTKGAKVWYSLEVSHLVLNISDVVDSKIKEIVDQIKGNESEWVMK